LINQIFVNYSCRINNVAILKELKELKKIVADTQRELEREKQEREREKREFKHKNQELEREKQELEREKQELEQLRSYLTASAPQQGIDSLPKSLLAQTDDQGTGQPPSNNDISLSME
jgi:FKBP-type peptidyl-prolyl cis-trans isomerase